jgi:hypothetical protein
LYVGGSTFLFFLLLIYSHVHTSFGSFLTLAPSLLPSPPQPTGFQAEPILPSSLILLKREHKHNKKDQAFLLIEIRIVREIPILFKGPLCCGDFWAENWKETKNRLGGYQLERLLRNRPAKSKLLDWEMGERQHLWRSLQVTGRTELNLWLSEPGEVYR